MTDPMDALVAEALRAAGLAFKTGEGGGNAIGLDFHLTAPDVHIEVKRFHSPRIAEQMSRAPNVIAVQGEAAVRFFADLVARCDVRNDLGAPLASLPLTDALISLGVAGIQGRDAEGWGDEDEDQINLELTKAVLEVDLAGASSIHQPSYDAGYVQGAFDAAQGPSSSELATWVRSALRFIDLAEADPIDYADQSLSKDAAWLTKEGYRLFGASDEHSLADLETMPILGAKPAAAAGVEAERDEARAIARVFGEHWPYGQHVARDEALRAALCAVPPANARGALQAEASDPVVTEEMVERAAVALCVARGERPEGNQVRFVDGDAHVASFLDIARSDARAVLAAALFPATSKEGER